MNDKGTIDWAKLLSHQNECVVLKIDKSNDQLGENEISKIEEGKWGWSKRYVWESCKWMNY